MESKQRRYSDNIKLVKKCLTDSTSTDIFRPNIMGVYFDPKLNQAVSTNGISMTYSKALYESEFADKIVDFKDMKVIKKEYLKYSTVIPKKFDNSVTVSIGKHLKVTQKKQQLKHFLLNQMGLFYLKLLQLNMTLYLIPSS